MKLNQKKMKLAVLCNVCLERQADKRELMFLNSWWTQHYIYKGWVEEMHLKSFF